jgi:hypothetical protein
MSPICTSLGLGGTKAAVPITTVIASGLGAIAMTLFAVSARAELTNISPSCFGGTTTPPYLGCSGAFAGNDTPQTADILTELKFLSDTSGWFVLGKSDDAGSGPFASNPETNLGTLTFDSPITGQFALSLKAGNAFSLFYYNPPVPVSEIDFNTLGVSINGNGIARDLSHATLYAVPQAGTYGFMLVGLGMVGFAAARRRKK